MGQLNKGLQMAVITLYNQNMIESDKDISEKTGYGKSTVSEYINGHKRASADFIKKFESAFELKIIEPVTSSDPSEVYLPLGDIKVTVADYINLLQEYNAQLKKDKEVSSATVDVQLLEIMRSIRINHDLMKESFDQLKNFVSGNTSKDPDKKPGVGKSKV